MSTNKLIKNILNGYTEFQHDHGMIRIPNKEFIDEENLKYLLEEDPNMEDMDSLLIDIEDMAWEYFTNGLSIKVIGL